LCILALQNCATHSQIVPNLLLIHKLTKPTLEAQRMIPSDTEVRNLCLYKGYDYDEVRELVKAWGYVGHIPFRDEHKQIIHDIPNYRARRWVVERTHSWMNRFRRLLVRWEKYKENYLGMIHLACACIAIRAIQVFG
jgi:transposase